MRIEAEVLVSVGGFSFWIVTRDQGVVDDDAY